MPSPEHVLITGAGGFIGSHLTEECVRRGFKVRAFLRYNSKNQRGWLEESEVREDVEFVFGDIRDFDSVNRAVRGVSTVFHLAALIGIPYSYESPLAYIRTNIEGTYNVLEAARMAQTQEVLVTSTSETYGSAQFVPITEEHPLVGQSPYSATKIGADQLALSYHRAFGMPIKVVRPFNTYGPRQSARAIIPTVITQILRGQTTLTLGNTTPTRDLTFVQDTAAGFLAIQASAAAAGKVTNIGMDEEISVGDLVKLIARLMGAEITIAEEAHRVRPAASEVERLRCDATRLREATGWKPTRTLETGLGETIEWFRTHMNFYTWGKYAV